MLALQEVPQGATAVGASATQPNKPQKKNPFTAIMDPVSVHSPCPAPCTTGRAGLRLSNIMPASFSAVLSTHNDFSVQPFEEYWSKEAVQRGLKSGDLIQVLYSVLTVILVHQSLTETYSMCCEWPLYVLTLLHCSRVY